MRKLISTFAALIAVSCAPGPVLAAAPVPCDKLGHYTMLVVDMSVTPKQYHSWLQAQKFSAAQLEELNDLDGLIAAAAKVLTLTELDRLPGLVYEQCMKERSV